MFDVATCGFSAVALASGPEHHSVMELPSVDADDFVEQAYNMLSSRDSDRRVLVLHPAGGRDARKVMMVRSLLRTASVASIPLQLPVTAMAATASWLAGMAKREVPAGITLACLDSISQHLPSYAVTTSVARLDLPQVRLGHHLMSWFPGSVFGITFGSSPRIELGRVVLEEPPTKGPIDLVTAGDQLLADRLGDTVPTGVMETVHLEVPDSRALWWGKARYYEHCVVPRDIDEFAAAATKTGGLRRCPQCGDSMRLFCSFCLAREGVHA